MIQRASFPLRLELALRLGLISEPGFRGMKDLANLRHAFAHGDLDETIPPKRLTQLADAVGPLLHELDSVVRSGPPETAIRVVIIALHFELQEAIATWRSVRDAQLEALQRERQARARQFTPEFLAKLRREAEPEEND